MTTEPQSTTEPKDEPCPWCKQPPEVHAKNDLGIRYLGCPTRGCTGREIHFIIDYRWNTRVSPSAAPVVDEDVPLRRELRSSRHPHFTAADHERMKEALDALSDYPTEEEAEATLRACGTSGKEVVNEFIERLLRENLELKQKLATASPVQASVPAEGEVVLVDREVAARIVDICNCGSGPEFRAVNMRYHALSCSTHLATLIRALPPYATTATTVAPVEQPDEQ